MIAVEKEDGRTVEVREPTDEEKVLAAVNERPDGCSSFGLAVDLQIKRSVIEHHLDALVLDGRIQRTRNGPHWAYYPAAKVPEISASVLDAAVNDRPSPAIVEEPVPGTERQPSKKRMGGRPPKDPNVPRVPCPIEGCELRLALTRDNINHHLSRQHKLSRAEVSAYLERMFPKAGPRAYLGPNGERRCPKCEWETMPCVSTIRPPGNLRVRLKEHLMRHHNIPDRDALALVNDLERGADKDLDKSEGIIQKTAAIDAPGAEPAVMGMSEKSIQKSEPDLTGLETLFGPGPPCEGEACTIRLTPELKAKLDSGEIVPFSDARVQPDPPADRIPIAVMASDPAPFGYIGRTINELPPIVTASEPRSQDITILRPTVVKLRDDPLAEFAERHRINAGREISRLKRVERKLRRRAATAETMADRVLAARRTKERALRRFERELAEMQGVSS